MSKDWFHNHYTTQQLLNFLWDIAEELGLDIEDFSANQRCSIARALERTGVPFWG